MKGPLKYTLSSKNNNIELLSFWARSGGRSEPRVLQCIAQHAVQKHYFSTKKKVIVLHFFNRITTNVKVISIADVTMRVL